MSKLKFSYWKFSLERGHPLTRSTYRVHWCCTLWRPREYGKRERREREREGGKEGRKATATVRHNCAAPCRKRTRADVVEPIYTP